MNIELIIHSTLRKPSRTINIKRQLRTDDNGGKFIVYKGQQLPVRILTDNDNNEYGQATTYNS